MLGAGNVYKRLRQVSQHGRRSVIYRNRLYVGDRVAAIVFRRPGTNQRIAVVRACAGLPRFVELNVHRRAAVIRSRQGSSGRDGLAACQRCVRGQRARPSGRLRIADRNRLNERSRVAANIYCRPGTYDLVLVRAGARYFYFREVKINNRFAIVRNRYNRNSRNLFCAVNRNRCSGQADENRRYIVVDDDELFAGRNVTAIVFRRPATDDGEAVRAQTRIDGFAEFNIHGFVAVIGSRLNRNYRHIGRTFAVHDCCRRCLIPGRRYIVQDRDRLNVLAGVAAIILYIPAAFYHEVVRAGAQIRRFVELDIQRRTAVVGSRQYFSRIYSLRASGGKVGRKRGLYPVGLYVVVYSYRLAARNYVAAVVLRFPAANQCEAVSASTREQFLGVINHHLNATVVGSRVNRSSRYIFGAVRRHVRNRRFVPYGRLNVADDNRLYVLHEVAAEVFRSPRAYDRELVRAVAGAQFFAVDYLNSAVAVVRSRQHGSSRNFLRAGNRQPAGQRLVKRRCDLVVYYDRLERCRAVAAQVGSHPATDHRVAVRAVARYSVFGKIHRCNAAIIGSRRLGNRRNQRSANNSSRSGHIREYRRFGVIYRNSLRVGIHIAASVRSHPAANDLILVLATLRNGRFAEVHVHHAAVVSSRYRYNSRNERSARYRCVRRFGGQHGIRRVVHRDGLRVYVRVATSVRCKPGTADDEAVRAAGRTRINRLGEGHRGATAVIGRSDRRRSRNSRCALVRFVQRAGIEYRIHIVVDRDYLNQRRLVAANIRSNPGTGYQELVRASGRAGAGEARDRFFKINRYSTAAVAVRSSYSWCSRYVAGASTIYFTQRSRRKHRRRSVFDIREAMRAGRRVTGSVKSNVGARDHAYAVIRTSAQAIVRFAIQELRNAAVVCQRTGETSKIQRRRGRRRASQAGYV